MSIGTLQPNPLRDPVNGVIPQNPFQSVINRNRRPSANGTDWQNYALGCFWLYNPPAPSEVQELWQLVSLFNNFGKWVLVTSGNGSLVGLKADDGNIAVPLSGIVNIHNSDGYLVTTASTPNTVTINAGPLLGKSLTGDTGEAVPFTNGNINLVGDGVSITSDGDPSTSTITFSVEGDVATNYITNDGIAISAADTLYVLGDTTTISTRATLGDTIIISLATPFYSVGTFTPILSFGGGSVGIVYSSQNGKYTQIGNIVFFDLSIVITSKGSSTGPAVVSGFTIAPATFTLPVMDVALQWSNGLIFTAGNSIWGQFNNVTVGGINLNQGGSGITTTVLTDSNFSDSIGITLIGFYYTS